MAVSPVLDLNLIQLFVTIVQSGTLSEAAQRQGVTRSHVSRNLQKLERTLGAQLIRRTTRRLELTQQGTQLYEHGERIAREVESARHAVQRLGAEPTGHVRLSIPTGLGHEDLSPLLLRFAEQHPEVTLRVLFSNRVNDLIDAEIDVALRVVSEPPLDYVAREICAVQWHLCAAPAYLRRMGTPRQPADLSSAAFLSPPDGKPYVNLVMHKNAQSHTVKVIPRLQSEYFPFLAQGAREGAGIALLPHYIIQNDVKARRLRIVLPDYQVDGPGNKLFILTTPNPYPSSAVRAVIEFLRIELLPR